MKFKKYLDSKIYHKSENYEDIIKRLLREKVLDKETKQQLKMEYENSL